MTNPRIAIKSYREITSANIDVLINEADLLLIPECDQLSNQYLYPYKVLWKSAVTPITNISQHFRKNSDYRRWAETIEQSRKLGCEFRRERVTNDFFSDFQELYKTMMQSKERGSNLLPANWIDIHNRPDHKIFAYAARLNGEMIGAMIGYFDLPINQIHVSYLAIERIGGGVTSGLQLLLLEDAVKMKASILYGKDRNLYGVFASPGLIYNKSKLGLTPFPDPDVANHHLFLLNKPDLHDWMFFSLKSRSSSTLILNIFSDDFQDSESKYKSTNIAEIIIVNSETTIAEHRKVIREITLSAPGGI